jgi:hypothetical protein
MLQAISQPRSAFSLRFVRTSTQIVSCPAEQNWTFGRGNCRIFENLESNWGLARKK